VIQPPTGTVIVEEVCDSRTISKVAAYARVSSSDQKKDLETQLDRFVQFANANG
jgi:predicted site-specific integrase-resolvase